MKRALWLIAGWILLILFLSSCAPRTAQGEAVPVAASTSIQNKGSDTIVNLALRWAEAYQELHPDVRISVTGGGSGTGIAALIDGTVDIANASRSMKKEEIEAARARGIEPVEHVIARDAIAVIVNPGNPVNQLTLEQISLIYQGKINNWREVGGEDRPIVRLSRETNSGTHVYFLEEVIRLGQKDNKALFSRDTLLLPSSEGIITEVRDNPNAIGYDGLGYVTPEVKVLAVAKTADGPYVLPSVETVNSGAYPISRDLYMYTQKGAGPAVQEYLNWLLSPEAQKIVLELGFVPVQP
ncbi:PstS family phosphate ABC transporter substrate-binding protein [Anaerolinea thermophila]|uniref:PstS family phosphate ABC transporter substrate-binding protein n=1 Tax=Anaerolinea thermophila TaxID=167964 RepID=UPI0026ED03D8|nr:PstS family phosphate ABC transporter substrate-binding protein [Anaerolinea thermophila]